jgi:hypothetical protein
MIDLLDHEVEKIYDSVQIVQSKYMGKEANGDNLLRLQHELVERLADLGFGAIVDVTPTLAGEPVTVSISERLDNTPFDAERKRHEVKKRVEERHRDDPGDKIEGVV